MPKNLEKPYRDVVTQLKPHIRGGVRTSISGVTTDDHVVRASMGALPESLDEDVVIGAMAKQAEVAVAASKGDKTGGTSSFKATGRGVAELFGHEPTAKDRGLARTPKAKAETPSGEPVAAS